MARTKGPKKDKRLPLPPDLAACLRKARVFLLPAALPAILNSGLNVVLMLLLKESLDAAMAGQVDVIIGLMPKLFLLVLLFIPSDLFSAWVRSLYLRRANSLIKGRYIDRVFQKNISEFQNQHLALYLSNITHDMNTVEQRYFLSLYEAMRRAFSALGGMVILVNVNWLVALLALVPSAIVSFFAVRSGRGLEKHEGERSDFLKDYTIYVRQVLSAFRIIKNNALEGKIEADFLTKSQGVQDKKFQLDKAETRVLFRNNLFFSIMIAILLVAAMLTVRSGLVTAGGVVLVINGYSQIINAFYMVAERLPQIASVRPVFLRMEEVLANQEIIEETEDFPGFQDRLRFDRVSFAYGDNQVLDQASFDIKAGGKYMLVGPSGGGKSTVLRLLRKYFKPDQGQILLDGTDLARIDRTDYYQHLANVEQQVFLFDDSLRHNLTLFKDYSQEAILEAVKAAGLSDFLESLPGGLDYQIIDNGRNLSGGERARIAIARGLIAQADLLLLDEAFASLDEAVARRIEKTLLALEGVTVVSVSHVIFQDTAPFYDAIFEVKRGGVSVRPMP